MASLRDLVRTIFPLARPVGSTALDPARGEREVTWVRVLKARVPAFDALEGGDLAIIPGPALAVVAPNLTQVDELAAALARARVPAVILVDGDGGADSVEALGKAAADAGLTVLRVGRTDPIALERSVIGFLVNRRAELDRRAADLEGQLARLALLGRGLDVLAAAIGAFLGRAVVIEGRRGDPIAVHAPGELPGAGAAVTRYLATPSAAALRVAIPAPADEPGAGGRLVLLGDDPPNELERIAADRIAALLALELARDAAVRQAREETRRGDPLPAEGPPWVVVLARQAAADRPDDIAAREETRAELRLLVSPRRLGAARHEREPRAPARRGRPRRRPGRPRDRRPDRVVPRPRGRGVATVRGARRPARRGGLGAGDARGGRGARRPAGRGPRVAIAGVPAARERPEPA